MRWFLQFDGRVTRKHGIARETPTGPKFRVEPLEPRLLLSGDPPDLLKDSREPQLAPEPGPVVQDSEQVPSAPSIDWGNDVVASPDDATPRAEQITGPLAVREPTAPVEVTPIVRAQAQTSALPSSPPIAHDVDPGQVASTDPLTSQASDGHDARGPPHEEHGDSHLGNEHALLASSEPADTHRALRDADVLPVVDALIARWTGSTRALDVSDLRARLGIEVVDLPRGLLGRTNGSTIQLDPTAAGYGWFVDSSPSGDDEFQPTASATLLSAPPSSPARGRMDLLTVVEHSVGHLLGLDQGDSMVPVASVLLPGRRLLLPNPPIGQSPVPADVTPMEEDETAPPVLDLSEETGNLTISLAPNRDVMIAGAVVDPGRNSTFDGVDEVVSGSGDDTLVAPDLSNVWTITAADSGTLEAGDLSPVAFSGVENLKGGAGSDTFVMTPEASLRGVIAGGEGSDTLVGADTPNTWVINGTDAGTLNGQAFAGIENLTGGAAADTFKWTAGGGLSGVLSGGSGDDTLLGGDTPNTWILTGAGAGTLNGHAFVGIENLVGGADSDRFVFDGGSGIGRIDGGARIKTLDYP